MGPESGGGRKTKEVSSRDGSGKQNLESDRDPCVRLSCSTGGDEVLG